MKSMFFSTENWDIELFLLESMDAKAKGPYNLPPKVEYHLQGGFVTLREARGRNLGPYGQL